MIIVADASPLVTLAICDCLHVLENLFEEVKVA
jgi:predicted nucleic acid-binding protein